MSPMMLWLALALAQAPEPPQPADTDTPATPTTEPADTDTPATPTTEPADTDAAQPVAPVQAPPHAQPVDAPAPDAVQPSPSSTPAPAPTTLLPQPQPFHLWPFLDKPRPEPSPPTPQVVQPIVSVDVMRRILPWLPMRGLGNAILLSILTLLSAAAAMLAARLREELPSTGLLPRLTGFTQLGMRVLVVFFALGVIAALIPRSIAPALPLVVLAAAAAVGWSTRDFLPDVVAGVLMAMERRLRPGQWIRGDGFEGSIETLGARATWIRDRMGRQVQIPNRRLLKLPLTADVDRWPAVEVVLDVPEQVRPEIIRRTLIEATLLCPWLAPNSEPILVRDPDHPRRWRVRARLLEGRFADRFEGALRERLDLTLGA